MEYVFVLLLHDGAGVPQYHGFSLTVGYVGALEKSTNLDDITLIAGCLPRHHEWQSPELIENVSKVREVRFEIATRLSAGSGQGCAIKLL